MPTTVDMPDTVFLPERARLAVNCLSQCLNKKKDYLPYCLMDITGSPARMSHTQFDYSDHTARVIDALLLASAMTGMQPPQEELHGLERLFDQGFAADGLHYTPDNPWSFRHANMHYQRSVINALLAQHFVRGSEKAAERLRALTAALAKVSIKREGFAYFPSVERLPDGWPRGDWAILGWGVDPANTNGRLIFGLTRAWEALQDVNARDLAAAYAAHVMDHSSAYLPDGSFATGMEFREGHFHSRAVTMLGVIRYGYGCGNARAVAWGKRVFDAARAYGTTFGWFPERVVKSKAHGCETCAIVDMMEAAIWLARSGHDEYWQVAERFLRNQLLESQLTDISWLPESKPSHQDGEWETTQDVARRALGGFAGWSQPNDFVSKVMHKWDLYTCCCAQGVRGLFNAWSNATTGSDRELQVNLLVNHMSERATVRSWLPHEGVVQIIPHQTGDILVRVPSWVDPRSLTIEVNGEPVPVSMPRAEFARIAGVDREAKVECRFPVKEATSNETVLDVAYAANWRGDSVMSISLEGTYAPLYRHKLHAQGTVPTVKRTAPAIGFAL